ncbi:NAD(P)/FAD-dependent oxidoreductase [Microbacterium keratanolyticum]
MSHGHVAVIGAGALGLFTAYELVCRGAEVTVYDRLPIDDIRNASWGNAGHIVPVMSVPLTSVPNITAVFRSAFERNSFMVLPRRVDRKSIDFLTRFAVNSRATAWRRAIESLIPIDRLALAEFDRLTVEGLDLGFERAPFVSAFRTKKAARAQFADLLEVSSRGLDLDIALLNRDELRRREPLSQTEGQFGVVLENQGLLQPPRMLRSLVEALTGRGVTFVTATVTAVTGAKHGTRGVSVSTADGAMTFDKAVISSGAWLDELSAPHGVRPRVLAGFGYSLRVDVPDLPEGMLYFPEAKIATTRMGDSLRVSTLMQIDSPQAPFNPRGAQRLQANARRVLPAAHWDTAREIWHGGRPISSDGVPIIGETRTKNVYVNGGHGMWGVTLGPISARLLAEAMLDDRPEIDLAGFSPRRR